MTKLPTETWDVVGIDGPAYQLNMICAKPSCRERATEAHHCWRRSHLGGAFSWVVLPDGSWVGNIVKFCNEHHRALTENNAWLAWEQQEFWWAADGGELLPLTYQPPSILGDVEPQFENPGEKTRLLPKVMENECPTCHQALPHPKPERPKEQARPRRAWTITVPVDQRENGAAVLDELLEEARLDMDKAGLSYGSERGVKYFVLATALALFVQHFEAILGDA